MPYGVRRIRNGNGPDWFFGTKIFVCRRTPSRAGIITSRSVNAAAAATEDGRSIEVVDLRTISPLDLDPVYESVRRTGRCVVVHEAPSNISVSAEVAARVTEKCFYSLEAPVLRVTGFDTPYPAARVEEEYLPDLDRVLDAVDRTFGF